VCAWHTKLQLGCAEGVMHDNDVMQAGSQFRHKAEPAGYAKGDAWVPGKNVTMTLQVC
jgi:hypothetical protein